VDGQNVSAREQLVFRHIGGPGLFGGLGGQVRAPRDDVHPERRADLRDPAADPPQPQHAQRRAAELPADGGLPAAVAHRYRLVDDPAGGRQDQRPGELDGRLQVAAGAADVDAAFFGGRDVDGGVEGPGRRDHLQSGQPLDDAARQRCALPHHAHHIEGLESLDHRIRVAEVIVEHGDRRPVCHLRPVGHGQCDVLVIVEDRDPHPANLAHPVWRVRLPGISPDAKHSVQRRGS
jgi:hypothetical protein